MILKFITKSAHNRGVSFPTKNSRNSLSFFIQGDVSGNNSLYEYHIQKINPNTFNIKCIKCHKYLILRNEGISVRSEITTSGEKRYVYDTNVTEEQLLDVKNYSNPYHHHNIMCTPNCRAKHTKNCEKKKFRPIERIFRTNMVRQCLKFKEDTPSEVFKIVTRLPNIIPTEIDPNLHYNWATLLNINKKNELQAVHYARTQEEDPETEYEYLTLNENYEETRYKFLRRYENFDLLVLDHEIEYLNGSHIQMDGTFKDANQSKLFRQTLVLSVNFFNTDNSKIIAYPVAFAVMKTKKKELYADVLQALKNLASDNGCDLKPRSIMTDLEKSEIWAVLEVFPETKVRLCSVHLLRVLRKKLLNVCPTFMQITALRQVWILLKGIPFINWDGRQDLVFQLFSFMDGLKVAIPKEFHSKFDDYLDYLRQNYFNQRDIFYNPRNWSHSTFAEEGCTVFSTNQAEGLNRSYNKFKKNVGGRIRLKNVFNELGRFKIKELDRKNMALRTNWSCVRNRTTKVRNRYQAIIELVHQFVSMHEVEQQENLILHLEKISRRNIDLTSTIFNRDYNVRLFSYVGRNGNENLTQNL